MISIRTTLHATAELGSRFTLGIAEADTHPIDTLHHDSDLLRTALRGIADRLGTTEHRVAASSLQYDIAERLWSIVLGTWHVGRTVVDLRRLRVRIAPDGTVQLSVPEAAALPADRNPLPTIAALVIDGHLRPLHAGLRTSGNVAEPLLWGNAAAGLALAVQTITERQHAPDIAHIATNLLARQPLAGTLRGPVTGPITRRSCCLYYRTTARRTCSDCPLPNVPQTRHRLDPISNPDLSQRDPAPIAQTGQRYSTDTAP